MKIKRIAESIAWGFLAVFSWPAVKHICRKEAADPPAKKTKVITAQSWWLHQKHFKPN